MADEIRALTQLVEVTAEEAADHRDPRFAAYLRDQLAALDAYGQPDDDPRRVAARDQLAALDDVDQVDAPAPAPTRKGRRP